MNVSIPVLRGVCAWIFLLTLGSGCRQESTPAPAPDYGEKPAVAVPEAEYIFAINPLHNPVRLFEIYQPMVDMINQQTGDFRLKLETSENFAAFEGKLTRRTVHFALPNPYQTLRAEKSGYRVFAKRSDDEKVRGVILIRKDSNIKEIADLKGATISFPAPTALFATMMPKYYLKKQGLDIERDARPVYVGTQDSAIMSVYQGVSQAGGSWLGVWEQLIKEKPEVAETVMVKWMTDPLINNSLMVRDDVPEAHAQKVREIILALHTTPAGQAVLAKMNLSRYDAANSGSYEPVRVFIKQYEAEFGAELQKKEKP